MEGINRILKARDESWVRSKAMVLSRKLGKKFIVE